MALPWVRLDTQWPQNPKFLMLAEDKKWRAISVYVASLGYSGAHGTDGFLPTLCLPFILGTKREAFELCEVRLWVVTPGGWDINGWNEFQPSNDETIERRRRAKLAAEARWAKKGVANDL